MSRRNLNTQKTVVNSSVITINLHALRPKHVIRKYLE